MGFKPPEWASQPCREATLEVRRSGGAVDSHPIDAQPWYVIGREASACDIVLDGGSASRQHAALVHHSDGRLFLIDLQSVREHWCSRAPGGQTRGALARAWPAWYGSKSHGHHHPCAPHLPRPRP
jgi:hypothetical protein